MTSIADTLLEGRYPENYIPQNGDSNDSACLSCLRTAYLRERLASRIQSHVDLARPIEQIKWLFTRTNAYLTEAIVSDPGHQNKILQQNAELDYFDMLEDIDKADCFAVCQHSEHYPDQLKDLKAAAPPVLFGRGDMDLLTTTSIAIVGARKASGYGLEIAATLGRGIARDFPVLSSMAMGIAGAAHRGALESGSTIAVLPCGPDRPYPATHTRLYRQIVERGLVISEMPPGADAWRWSFTARNRIIAALAERTILVEATEKSAAVNTIHRAGRLNRWTGAVPGPVTSNNSNAPNDLIVNRDASCVVSTETALKGLI